MLIGSMIRDMQIIVLDNQNDPPEIQDLNDTCIVAGSTLNINVSATDPNTGQYITLQGQGGPLEYGSNPASFALTSSQGLVSSNFIWNTGCNDIRRHFYSVIFKAEDDFSFGFTEQHLVDLKTWRIWVVAPPPKNLIATPYMNNIKLEWDSLYDCASASHFKGFSLWRKEGSNAFNIDSCETGLSGKGYYKIADKLSTYFYNDLNLNRGKSYCYRVLAHFHLGSDQFPYNETESLPSNEACAELMQDIPLITKASVLETSSSFGKMNLSWTKPIADDLDTIQNSGPYNYEIYRGTGLSPNSFSLIHSITDMNYYSFNDTSYLDSNLNTIDNAYTYYIRFNSNSILIGDAPTSSSIFLGIGETDNTLNLSWDENTAWINSEYHIYRKNSMGIFDSIGVSNNKSYSDTGLANGDEYCYKIKSSGAYSDTNIYKPLINWSQEDCGTPIDTIPPCPPEISVYNYCEDIPDDIWQSHYYYNLVSWPAMSEACADDIVQYNIYYKANQFLNYGFISSLSDKNDTSFIHNGLIESVAGCYYVTAIDSYYNESPMSNEVCVDNCPVYVLPNIFTPNGDKANDIFTPFMPFRFIDHIELKVYNRWGNQVFETKDAEINWDGYNLSSGKKVQSGVYFYTCDLFEKRLSGVVKSKTPLKGWIEIIY
ncbi:MAG TPA: gliding motility-associated C-terminal domain-containing protein [Bacteroidetes bacterium]|nr:gliding motility-associated C-terminal domain-containing protein [Bacteroidota bacterium]